MCALVGRRFYLQLHLLTDQNVGCIQLCLHHDLREAAQRRQAQTQKYIYTYRVQHILFSIRLCALSEDVPQGYHVVFYRRDRREIDFRFAKQLFQALIFIRPPTALQFAYALT